MSQSAKDVRSLSRQEFEKEVLSRAQGDAAFRQQLLADPRAALKAAFGVELPPDVGVQVLEETPTRFYIVLPVQTSELSDEQLAQVSGGVGSAAAGSSVVQGTRFFASTGGTGVKIGTLG